MRAVNTHVRRLRLQATLEQQRRAPRGTPTPHFQHRNTQTKAGMEGELGLTPLLFATGVAEWRAGCGRVSGSLLRGHLPQVVSGAARGARRRRST